MSRILVIDDQLAMAKFVSDSLVLAGFEVQALTESTIACAVAREFKPDLVIVDLDMPHLDGYSVVKQLRQERQFLKTPVLILTKSAVMQSTPDQDFAMLPKTSSVLMLTQQVRKLLAAHHGL